MKVKQLIEALQKWPQDNDVTIMFEDNPELAIVEVNEPLPLVYGPVIWARR